MPQSARSDGVVPRASRIVVDAFDLDGQQFEMEVSGWDARVIQHEYDHIEGIMFPDRVSPAVMKEIQPAIEALELDFTGSSRRAQFLTTRH